ncbi:uncharacterized protein DKFZp434B061-like [Bos javanicus]|uniref:uncharacterized protein DKFZp434B061-like n=1 Tax=Bos javanicus TaxID=9906 RepID=UPI002AA6F159|nr:uncharacterized protein DKFZp434B061-like [Bos javanicus]
MTEKHSTRRHCVCNRFKATRRKWDGVPTARRWRPTRGRPRGGGERNWGPPRLSLPRLERRLQLSSERRTPPGPREIPKLCPPSHRPGPPSPPLRQSVHPTPQRQLPAPVRPRGRPVFTSGRGRGAGSGGGGSPTAGPQVPVTPPPSSPTWTPSASRYSGGAEAPALLAGAGGGGGGAGSGPGLRCSARLAPPLLPLPPPRLASSRSAPRVPFPLPRSPPLSRAATGRRATVTPAAAAAAADPPRFPYSLALALRARLQRSTRPQGGAGNPPFTTEERDGRSQVTRPASRREGPS